MSDGLPDRLRDRIRDALADEDDVVLAYLHGSVAQDRQTDRSDIDVGVLLDEVPSGLDRAIEFNEVLSRALEVPGERIDVKVLNDAPLRLVHQVLMKGEAVLVRDESRRVAFEADAMDRYFDFKPMLERQARARRERFRGKAT